MAPWPNLPGFLLPIGLPAWQVHHPAVGVSMINGASAAVNGVCRPTIPSTKSAREEEPKVFKKELR